MFFKGLSEKWKGWGKGAHNKIKGHGGSAKVLSDSSTLSIFEKPSHLYGKRQRNYCLQKKRESFLS